jgi:hypothetical protein
MTAIVCGGDTIPVSSGTRTFISSLERTLYSSGLVLWSSTHYCQLIDLTSGTCSLRGSREQYEYEYNRTGLTRKGSRLAPHVVR